MRKRIDHLEEYHSGKTTDLRNVVAEIQKVDEETRDLQNVVAEVKRKTASKKTYTDRGEVLVTCRLLFSSFLDKILLILLLIGFIITSFLVFKGNIFHGFYGFWGRVLKEIGVILLFGVIYFICNILYHYAIRSMLCLTRNQIYKECYLPFVRRKISIPLEHVTCISTVNFFFIFRSIVIHRYHQLPMIYFTWNNMKFKNKFMELKGENGPITNYYDDTALLAPRYHRFVKWFFTVFFMILVIIGVFHFFGYIFSKERSLAGTYQNKKNSIVLQKDGHCKIRVEKATIEADDCTWSIVDDQEIQFHIRDEVMNVPYNDKALLYGKEKYTRK